MLAKLDGYKTYIVATLSIASAWVNVWAGTVDQQTAFQITETALLGMTIRHGISTSKGQ